MPPKGMPQPADAERQQAVTWIRAELTAYAKKHDGDPGRVTVRRLTSGEYAYAIHDLTGIDPELGIDAASDSVGGEGFTNFGDVQFMQDANLERYLAAAKIVANHAVIGAGPLEFFADPGKTGFELSAITRIKRHLRELRLSHRFGRGRHSLRPGKIRQSLLRRLALSASRRPRRAQCHAEGSGRARRRSRPRFAQHIWTVINQPALGYPSSEMVGAMAEVAGSRRRRSRPSPRPPREPAAKSIQKFLTTWPSWLFGRGDVAAGGAGDESPLVFNDKSLKAEAAHHFIFNRFGRGGGGAGRGAPPRPDPPKLSSTWPRSIRARPAKPVIIWRNPTVGFRAPARRRPRRTQSRRQITAGAARASAAAQPQPQPQPVRRRSRDRRRGRGSNLPCRACPCAPPSARKPPSSLDFGTQPRRQPNRPRRFRLRRLRRLRSPRARRPVARLDFQVDAAIGADRDQVFRITISDREEGPRGIPTARLRRRSRKRRLSQIQGGRHGVRHPPAAEFQRRADARRQRSGSRALRQHLQHAGARRVRQRREVHPRRSLCRREHARRRHPRRVSINAWNDLYASFAYHDNYLRLLAEHYKLDLKGKHIADLDERRSTRCRPKPANTSRRCTPSTIAVRAAEAAARPRHI